MEATSHHPEYADVNVISNIINSTGGTTGLSGDHVENFHTDLSWFHLPTKVTFLKSEILPTTGGDTHYVDSSAAYQNLPLSVKDRIKGLKGVYSYLKFRSEVPGITGANKEYLEKGQVHPLITTHPETGVHNIYANSGHTVRVLDVSDAESQQILQTLFDAINEPQFLYVHKWCASDAVLWDNRAMQHKATPAPRTPRRLVRTTVSNDDIPKETIQDVPPFAGLRAQRLEQGEVAGNEL